MAVAHFSAGKVESCSVTTAHKLTLAAAAILLLGVLYALHAYQVAQTKAEEKQKATDQLLAAKDQALADRDKAFNEFKAQMLAEIADIKTQKQAVTVLQPIVQGQSPQVVTKADLPASVQQQLPGDPGTNYTLLTDDQVINLGKREKACELTEAALSKCDQDKADLQEKVKALQAANAQWAKVGAVPPYQLILGASKNAAGNGFSPTLLVGRRLKNNLGIVAGVQGKGDFTLGLSYNFGSVPK